MQFLVGVLKGVLIGLWAKAWRSCGFLTQSKLANHLQKTSRVGFKTRDFVQVSMEGMAQKQATQTLSCRRSGAF